MVSPGHKAWLWIADIFTLAAGLHGVLDPIKAIVSGSLWGGGAFIAGAAVVSSATFCEYYLRMRDDDYEDV